MDGSLIVGIVLVTVGAAVTLPHWFAWSDGAALHPRRLGPGLVTQVCGGLVATQAAGAATTTALVAAAWLAAAVGAVEIRDRTPIRR